MAETRTALVSEITSFSTHDGPGIRTTVFLKGCPLRCKWCSNPETHTKTRQLFYMATRCCQCGRCEAACPLGAISSRYDSCSRIDRTRCNHCMKCVDTCLVDAFRISGEQYSTDELMAQIEREKVFFGDEGGITISGGEPLSSADFVLEIFQRCKAQGISTVLDTTGYGDATALAQILEYTDLALLDIKHMDSSAHKYWTGVGNELILENARSIADTVKTRISFPLIGGANNDRKNIEATANFAVSLGAEAIDINPLHTLGAAKYHYLGKQSPYGQFTTIEKSELNEVAEVFRSRGLAVGIGRMM